MPRPDEATPDTGWGLLPRSLTGTGVRLSVTWLVSRLIMLEFALPFVNDVTYDVYYYWQRVSPLGRFGSTGTLEEYPIPVVWILELPGQLSHSSGTYLIAFSAMMIALDIGMLVTLWHAGGRRYNAGTDLWLVFTFALGAIIYLRIDLIPAVLVGFAVLAIRRHPGLAGAAIGLGAAVKLWPALLLPALLPQRPTREGVSARRRMAAWTIAGFVLAGIGLAILSLAIGGEQRLLSPLWWQSDRGLQIESVWASPLMILRWLQPGTLDVHMSPYNADELFGPGVSAMLTISTAATLLGLAIIAALVGRAFRHPQPDRFRLSLLALAVVMVVIVSNKTLSPQYMIWMGGPMAVLLLDIRADDARRGPARSLAWAVVALGLATQLVYPVAHVWLTDPTDRLEQLIGVALLVGRNIGLLAVTVWVVLWCWRSLRTPVPAADPSG